MLLQLLEIENNSQNTQSMFREKTVFYSAQGARWKISTNHAHLLRFIIGCLFTKVTKSSTYPIQLFHLSNAYSLCYTSRVVCTRTAIVLSQQSHLRLRSGLRGSLVLICRGRPLLILSLYGRV